MTEEQQKLERHLTALEGFMAGPAYQGYLAAIKQEIEITKQLIVSLEPIDPKSIGEQLMFHGELRCLQGSLSRFEDARATLKDSIDEMIELENEAREKPKNE